jgi:hypothetical protein
MPCHPKVTIRDSCPHILKRSLTWSTSVTRCGHPTILCTKFMAGLLDVYEHCDNQQALDILEKLADWLLFRIRRLTQEQMEISLLNEPGGITEALANLYAITQKPEHKELLLAFNHELVLDPLARGEDLLDRLHANTQIPKAIGAALQYEVTGDTRSRKIAEFFWQRVALARSYAIGGNSDDECSFRWIVFHSISVPRVPRPAIPTICSNSHGIYSRGNPLLRRWISMSGGCLTTFWVRKTLKPV